MDKFFQVVGEVTIADLALLVLIFVFGLWVVPTTKKLWLRIKREFARTDDWFYLKKWETIAWLSERKWFPKVLLEFVMRRVS
jgi:hypothetical protein